MRMQTLSEYLDEAKSNKKQRAHTDRYQIIRNDEEYPAFVVDAWYDKEKGEIAVCFIVFVSSIGVKREVKFRIRGAGAYYYEDMCETLGTSGNPWELIGKALYLHFEKNGEFQNVRVDMLISEAELREALGEMEEQNIVHEKKRKASKVEKTGNKRKQRMKIGDAAKMEKELGEDSEMECESDVDDELADFA